MNNEQDKSHPLQELAWLAHYYHQHGFKDKAREILERLNIPGRDKSKVVDMFENHEERRA